MSRTIKVPKEFITQELPNVNIDSNFFDIVSKFGPLVIAIIAVAFCFYIYKKVAEMENTPVGILKNFIEDQTRTNFNIQESYNVMVEQFNKLSSVVHNDKVTSGTIETQISPDPSINQDSTLDESITEILDTGSEVSVKARKTKKSKNEVNL